MIDEESHIHDITTCVWNFVDEIAADKVADEILKAHGLTDVAISAIRRPGYIGLKVYRRNIFMHLMDSIGYYQLLSEGADKIQQLTIDEVKKRLYIPSCWQDFKTKPMANYPLITGVKDSMDYIKNSLHEDVKCGGIGSIVPNTNDFKRIDRGYEVSFARQYDRNLDDNFNQCLEGVPFKIGSNGFVIQKHGCHISKWSRYITQDDEISICLSHFNTDTVNTDKSYYQRYITEIDDYSNIVRNISIGLVSLDGISCEGSIFDIEGVSYSLYFYKNDNRNYMSIDSNVKVTERQMRDVVFSISVAIGLLTGNLHLNEYWMVASEDKDSRNPVGLFYSQLTPSVTSDYKIFTTNVYSVLIPVAKKINPANGERRALSIIDHLKLPNALNPLRLEVFAKIVENFCRYESLQRGVFILLTGTHLPLELQPAAFAVALEAICNISKYVMGELEAFKLRKPSWKKVRPALDKLAEDFYSNGTINGDEKDYLLKKFGSLNDGFNSDKLTALLEYYEYPLTEFDRGAIKFRNPLLHGDINIKKMHGSDFDKLFSLSMRLHKLCCSIPLLMAGYDGYIINNCKLYGYEDSCKAFIRLGKKIPNRKNHVTYCDRAKATFLSVLDQSLRVIGLRRI